MSGEHWKSIEAEIKRVAAVAKRKAEKEKGDAARKRREDRLRDAAYKEERRLEEAARRAEIDGACQALWDILDAFKSNSPDIKRAKLKELKRDKDTITLRWGTKFELTPEEREFIDTHQRARLFSSQEIPAEILEYSFHSIEGTVDDHYLSLKHSHDAEHLERSEFIRRPNIIVPTLDKWIKDPSLQSHTNLKGRHYWVTSRTRREWARPEPITPSWPPLSSESRG